LNPVNAFEIIELVERLSTDLHRGWRPRPAYPDKPPTVLQLLDRTSGGDASQWIDRVIQRLRLVKRAGGQQDGVAGTADPSPPPNEVQPAADDTGSHPPGWVWKMVHLAAASRCNSMLPWRRKQMHDAGRSEFCLRASVIWSCRLLPVFDLSDLGLREFGNGHPASALLSSGGSIAVLASIIVAVAPEQRARDWCCRKE